LKTTDTNHAALLAELRLLQAEVRRLSGSPLLRWPAWTIMVGVCRGFVLGLGCVLILVLIAIALHEWLPRLTTFIK